MKTNTEIRNALPEASRSNHPDFNRRHREDFLAFLCKMIADEINRMCNDDSTTLTDILEDFCAIRENKKSYTITLNAATWRVMKDGSKAVEIG